MVNIITNNDSFIIDDGNTSNSFLKNSVNIYYNSFKNSLNFYLNLKDINTCSLVYDLNLITIDGVKLTNSNIYNQLDKLFK
jgi:hypothetical protein